ncbi:transcription factor E2F8-like [Cyrtonyx montezumae]|uniref:transcription factor E2F8-like n=1 Tax=Cyrtonyx montezumae TaxID=9017 RepID=UPI0032DBB8B7
MSSARRRGGAVPRCRDGLRKQGTAAEAPPPRRRNARSAPSLPSPRFSPQENRPDAPLRTPPKQAGCCQPLATPPKPGAALPAEPWTPTANLKLLIRAASLEIRCRERSRSQVPVGRLLCLSEHSPGDERGRAPTTRREKSLGSLCRRFLARYPDYPSAEENYCICLDEVAEELKCERRRIYDIVHVLESLHMLSRLAQNKYIWHGRHNLAKTLHTLKKAGEENKYMLLIETIKKREYKDEFDLDGKRSEEVVRSFSTSEQTEMCSVEHPGMEFRAGKVSL